MKKHELELDYLAPFLAQIGDPPHISRQEAYKLKEECLQDLKHRLIDKANLIQARFEKVCIVFGEHFPVGGLDIRHSSLKPFQQKCIQERANYAKQCPRGNKT